MYDTTPKISSYFSNSWPIYQLVAILNSLLSYFCKHT